MSHSKGQRACMLFGVGAVMASAADTARRIADALASDEPDEVHAISEWCAATVRAADRLAQIARKRLGEP